MQSVFKDFLIYKNLGTGLLAEEIGHVVFSNFTFAENERMGLEIYYANFTKENNLVQNSLFIGETYNNSRGGNFYGRGLVTPRTGSTNLSQVHFRDFRVGGHALVVCSRCDQGFLTTLGTELFTSGMKMTKINGSYIKILGVSNIVIYDEDGSLAKTANNSYSQASSTLVYFYNHIFFYYSSKIAHPSSSSSWAGLMICDPSMTIRRVYFTNAINKTGSSLYSNNLHVYPIFNETTPVNTTHRTIVPYYSSVHR